MIQLEGGGHRCEGGLGPLSADAVPQPGQHEEVPLAAVVDLPARISVDQGRRAPGQVELGFESHDGALELLRTDAHDGHRETVDQNAGAHHRRVGTETAAPGAVSQDGHRLRQPGDFLVGGEGPAEGGLEAEEAEEVGRGGLGDDGTHLSVVIQSHDAGVDVEGRRLE